MGTETLHTFNFFEYKSDYKISNTLGKQQVMPAFLHHLVLISLRWLHIKPVFTHTRCIQLGICPISFWSSRCLEMQQDDFLSSRYLNFVYGQILRTDQIPGSKKKKKCCCCFEWIHCVMQKVKCQYIRGKIHRFPIISGDVSMFCSTNSTQQKQKQCIHTTKKLEQKQCQLRVFTFYFTTCMTKRCPTRSTTFFSCLLQTKTL